MKPKILLADDSAGVQRMAARALEGAFDVVAVSNGDQAAAKLDEFRPDFVIADALMPGKDGYELCWIVKQRADTRDVPVILLYGVFEPFDWSRAQRAGADAYLAKPFQPPGLIDLIRQLQSRSAVDGSLVHGEVRNQISPELQAPGPGSIPAKPSLASSANPAVWPAPAPSLTACANHPDRSATAMCFNCKRSLCLYCLLGLFGRLYCRDCKVSGIEGLPLIPELAPTSTEAVSALRYAILALVCCELCFPARVILSANPAGLQKFGTTPLAGLFCFGLCLGFAALFLSQNAGTSIAVNPMLVGHGRVKAARALGVVAIVTSTLWISLEIASLVLER
ncbi:MAG TPA: response regulator [Blastocatellia bacterium]|nr:response regulator [Blastocatellia bacterium]